MSSLYNLVVSDLKEKGWKDGKLLSLLPRSYKRVGNIAILNLHKDLLERKIAIAECYLDNLSRPIKTIAYFVKSIQGITRKPTVEWLAGDKNLETVHIEHNTKFLLNPEKIMLSAGNHNERKRIINFVSDLEFSVLTVLDMFACVGNLSLPLAVESKKLSNKVKIIGLEINGEAINYLNKSILLNKLTKEDYRVIHGDNRIVCPSNIADLVIMGYFGIDEIQLVKAIQSLNLVTDSVWIMIHDIGNTNEDSKVLNTFKNLIESNKLWKLNEINKHLIKSIGPNFEHWVFDCNLLKI